MNRHRGTRGSYGRRRGVELASTGLLLLLVHRVVEHRRVAERRSRRRRSCRRRRRESDAALIAVEAAGGRLVGVPELLELLFRLFQLLPNKKNTS